jgi:hypothetical protein
MKRRTIATRHSTGLLPLLVTLACGGSSTSNGPGGTGGSGSGMDICGPGGCITDLPGEPIDPPGPVFCGGAECEAPRACCFATGQCFDPATEPDVCAEPPPDDHPQGLKPCTSNSQCTERQFCQLDGFSCQGSGHCRPRTSCGSTSLPVCGCDGNTYSNRQTACLAGANTVFVAFMAPCGETIETGGGGSGPGGAQPVRVRTPCATTSQCPAGETCCPRLGYCLTDDDPYLCSEPPPGTTRACITDEHCAPAEFCRGDGCSGPGGCVVVNEDEDCGVTLEPVCGCDGATYTSAACASTRAVRIASEGMCTGTE